MSETQILITINVPEMQVMAQYEGGAYISLSFGHAEFKATEVINVWDDETSKPEIPFTVVGVAGAVQEWMLSQHRDNPGWYEQYIENRVFS